MRQHIYKCVQIVKYSSQVAVMTSVVLVGTDGTARARTGRAKRKSVSGASTKALSEPKTDTEDPKRPKGPRVAAECVRTWPSWNPKQPNLGGGKPHSLGLRIACFKHRGSDAGDSSMFDVPKVPEFIAKHLKQVRVPSGHHVTACEIRGTSDGWDFNAHKRQYKGGHSILGKRRGAAALLAAVRYTGLSWAPKFLRKGTCAKSTGGTATVGKGEACVDVSKGVHVVCKARGTWLHKKGRSKRWGFAKITLSPKSVPVTTRVKKVSGCPPCVRAFFKKWEGFTKQVLQGLKKCKCVKRSCKSRKACVDAWKISGGPIVSLFTATRRALPEGPVAALGGEITVAKRWCVRPGLGLVLAGGGQVTYAQLMGDDNAERKEALVGGTVEVAAQLDSWVFGVKGGFDYGLVTDRVLGRAGITATKVWDHFELGAFVGMVFVRKDRLYTGGAATAYIRGWFEWGQGGTKGGTKGGGERGVEDAASSARKQRQSEMPTNLHVLVNTTDISVGGLAFPSPVIVTGWDLKFDGVLVSTRRGMTVKLNDQLRRRYWTMLNTAVLPGAYKVDLVMHFQRRAVLPYLKDYKLNYREGFRFTVRPGHNELKLTFGRRGTINDQLHKRIKLNKTLAHRPVRVSPVRLGAR